MLQALYPSRIAPSVFGVAGLAVSEYDAEVGCRLLVRLLGPGHRLAADDPGAKLVWAGPLDGQIPVLDHQLEWIQAGLEGKINALALPSRLIQRHHHLLGDVGLGRRADRIGDSPLDPIDRLLALVDPAVVPWGLDILPAAACRVQVADPPPLVVVLGRRALGLPHRTVGSEVLIRGTASPQLHDPVGPDDPGALAGSVGRREAALDEDRRAPLKADQPERAVLSREAALHCLGSPLDRPHHPFNAWVAGEEEGQMDIVGVRIEEGAVANRDLDDLPDDTFPDEFARLEPGGVVRALVRDQELDPVALAGDHHLLGLTQAQGHGLLADNRLGAAGRSGDDHLGVQAVPGADIHEIGALLVQHLAVVRVALVLGNAEEIAELLQCLSVGIRDGGDLDWAPGHVLPGASVNTGDIAAGDNGGAIHTQLLPTDNSEKTGGILPRTRQRGQNKGDQSW